MEKKLMHPQELIVEFMNRIYRRKLTTTSGGNLSIRDSEGNVWISPTGKDKGTLSPSDICKIYPDGRIEGAYKPSCELPFHLNVYKTRPDVNAVLHAHPSELVSYTLFRGLPDRDITYLPKKVCGEIGVAGYELPGSSDLADRIVEEIKKGINVVMMENHGVTAVGVDMFEAFKRFETYNDCACVAMSAKSLGNSYSLTEQQIALTEKTVKTEEFIPTDFSSKEKSLRKEIVDISKRSYEQKLFSCLSGTVSARIDCDSFVITPHGADRKYLEEEDLVRVDGCKVEKGKVPSNAYKLHELIYKAHPEINSIIMAKPAPLMGYAVTHSGIDSRTIPESFIAMRTVKNLPFGITITDPEKVAQEITVNTPVLLIENDCVLATGKSVINAFDRVEVASFTAETIIKAQPLGNIVMITDEEVELIKTAFCL